MFKTLLETNFNFPGQKSLYRGKVRDVYEVDDKIVLIATDRISAFDHILPKGIPYKGQVLNQIADYLLGETKKHVENWLLTSPDPNASIGSKAEPFRVEVVLRYLLVGQAWRDYKLGKRVICGVNLPNGLDEYDVIPEGPIITPTTKSDSGHDEPITEQEIIDSKTLSSVEWQRVKDYSFKLFSLGQEMAKERNLILADTKYEFGANDGNIILIDEVHTPDSSRYFYLDSYESYIKDRQSEKPKHLSKEFVREWLMENGFSGQPGQKIPKMTDEVVNNISKRYIELYEALTGRQFIKQETDNIEERIENNVTKALGELK